MDEICRWGNRDSSFPLALDLDLDLEAKDSSLPADVELESS